MADISKITLPSGDAYNIKDANAIHKGDNIPRTDVGLSSDAVTNGIDEVTRPLVGATASNKTFGLPASQITIEYSRDGGSTWVDYGATDAQKRALFAETRSVSLRPGKVTSTADNNLNNMLRVTINREDRYVALDCLYIWASTNGNTWTVDLDKSTLGAKTTFTNVFKDFNLGGWSGNNIKYFPEMLFGGSDSSQPNQTYALRLTFKQTSIRTTNNYGPPSLIDVRFYGTGVWTAPNNIVAFNRLYSWDDLLNATFPAEITATDFNGTINGHSVNADVPSGAKFTDTVTTATTSGSGNAVTAVTASNGALTVTKGSTFLTSHQTIKQDGVTGATVNRYGVCSTAAATAAKTVTLTTGTFSLETGALVHVKFTNSNTVANPTLNVNSTGAKAIMLYGTTTASTNTNTSWYAGTVVTFVYDGTNWLMADFAHRGNDNNHVRQTLQTGNANRPLLMAYSANTVTTSNVDNVAYRNNNIYANPSTGLITATNFANSKGTIGASYDSNTETITIIL